MSLYDREKFSTATITYQRLPNDKMFSRLAIIALAVLNIALTRAQSNMTVTASVGPNDDNGFCVGDEVGAFGARPTSTTTASTSVALPAVQESILMPAIWEIALHTSLVRSVVAVALYRRWEGRRARL